MNTEKKFIKPLFTGLLFFAFVYGLVLPFCWGNDPTSEYGTLSILCADHRPWFWLWGMGTSVCFVLNTQYMFRKYEYKNRFLDALCILALISMACVAITLGHPVDSWNTQRILHWVATGLFIAFTLAPIALFFIFNIKKFKRFGIFTVCSFIILATFLLIFGIMGKSAIMEMVPLAMFEVLLFVINFTPVGKPQRKD